MISESAETFTLRRSGAHWIATYRAMAGPCEIHLYDLKAGEARKLASLALEETRRIERKFSRYRDDNVVYAINNGDGAPVPIDDETFRLLEYAGQCYELSDGLFDITSGTLRRAWTFKGEEVVPDRALIDSLLPLVDWTKVRFDRATVALPAGMEIDFGGIGKEYAVDRVAELLYDASGAAVMVNFGGDIRATAADSESPPWIIGVESPSAENTAIGQIELHEGSVATSGDARRFCLVDGRRLGHILNPRTGWPVEDAPRSITVLADRCLECGLLATLGILHGKDAEVFLDAQNVKYYCVR